MTTQLGDLKIRKATDQDLEEIIALFDATVVWLAEQGFAEQWGKTPFSQLPIMVARFKSWIRQQALYVAQRDGAILGTIALGERPPFYARRICARYGEELLYLEAFTTDRRLGRQGIGRQLLQWAEQQAIQGCRPWLLLDCWAGNLRLRRYYCEAGFVEREAFTVGDWQGMLFERYLPEAFADDRP